MCVKKYRLNGTKIFEEREKKTGPGERYINYNNITTLADTVALITTNELSVLG